MMAGTTQQAGAIMRYSEEHYPLLTKFRVGPDPLEAEAKNTKIEPTSSTRQAVMGMVLRQVTGDDEGQLSRELVRKWEQKRQLEALPKQVDTWFAAEFMRWLRGVSVFNHGGLTPWGNANLFHIPEVLEYLREACACRADFQRKLVHLAIFEPRTLNDAYLYYKYIVMHHGWAKSDGGPHLSSHDPSVPPPPYFTIGGALDFLDDYALTTFQEQALAMQATDAAQPVLYTPTNTTWPEANGRPHRQPPPGPAPPPGAAGKAARSLQAALNAAVDDDDVDDDDDDDGSAAGKAARSLQAALNAAVDDDDVDDDDDDDGSAAGKAARSLQAALNAAVDDDDVDDDDDDDGSAPGAARAVAGAAINAAASAASTVSRLARSLGGWFAQAPATAAPTAAPTAAAPMAAVAPAASPAAAPAGNAPSSEDDFKSLAVTVLQSPEGQHAVQQMATHSTDQLLEYEQMLRGRLMGYAPDSQEARGAYAKLAMVRAALEAKNRASSSTSSTPASSPSSTSSTPASSPSSTSSSSPASPHGVLVPMLESPETARATAVDEAAGLSTEQLENRIYEARLLQNNGTLDSAMKENHQHYVDALEKEYNARLTAAGPPTTPGSAPYTGANSPVAGGSPDTSSPETPPYKSPDSIEKMRRALAGTTGLRTSEDDDGTIVFTFANGRRAAFNPDADTPEYVALDIMNNTPRTTTAERTTLRFLNNEFQRLSASPEGYAQLADDIAALANSPVVRTDNAREAIQAMALVADAAAAATAGVRRNPSRAARGNRKPLNISSFGNK